MSRGYSGMMCLIKRLVMEKEEVSKEKAEHISKYVASVRKASALARTAPGASIFKDTVFTDFKGFASIGIIGGDDNLLYALTGYILNDNGKSEFSTNFCSTDETITFSTDDWSQEYNPKNRAEIMAMMNEVSFKLALEETDES